VKKEDSAMKIYRGIRNSECTVTVDGAPLDLRLDLRSHSPTGPEWGYGGSGPAQLALALLADHFRDLLDGDERALGLYQAFKWRVVGRLPRDEWTLTSADIEQAIMDVEEQR
jgi:hypothetical protein